MPRVELIKNSFISGELSPRILGRTDLAKYHSGCESISNYIVRVQGGVVDRYGMNYITDAGGPNRLIPFKLSVSQQYVLEFGDHYIQFYVNNGQIQSAPGVPYRVATPYALFEVWDIHFAQNISIMYLVHHNHPPMKLIRINDTNWQLIQPNFYAAPATKQDQDVGTDKGASITIAGNTITASAPVFIAGDVGKAIVAGTGVGYITTLAGTTAIDGVTGATLAPQAIINYLNNPYDLSSYPAGSWFLRGGPLAYLSAGILDTSGATPYWKGSGNFGFGKTVPFRSTSAHPTDSSYQYSTGTSYSNVPYNQGFTDCFRSMDLGSYIPFSGGYCRVTQVSNSTSILATILSIPTVTEQNAWGNSLIAPAPPGSWYFETNAFGPADFPHAVCFFSDRLFFAGTEGANPNTVWGSGVGDYENFALGTLDSCAVRFTINSSFFDHIHWMTTYQGNIVMGGVVNEYVVNGGAGQATISAGSPITPNNINVITQSSYGVSEIQGILVDNDLIFIQKNRTRVYQFAFNAVSSSYGSRNLNVLNEIVTTAGFKEMVFQPTPTKIIWFTDLDGNLTGMTYDKEQDVWAWHRHFTGTDTGDKVISIANILGADGVTDQLWLLCQRKRGTGTGVMDTAYTVEVFDPNLNFDSGLFRNFDAPVTKLTGLQYLIGRPVAVVADGTYLPPITMDFHGEYIFPPGFQARNISVGIPYLCSLLTVRPEPRASIQGLIKRWLKLWVRQYQSIGVVVNGQEIYYRDPQRPIGTAIPPFTGDSSINNLGFDRDGRISIQQPYPFVSNILCTFGILEISDGV